MKAATYLEFDALTRLTLRVFVERVFAELNPGTDYLHNFHVDVIVAELEALRAGRRRRLAVAMPPRSLKSIIISVAWVAWLLGHDPALRIICVSYGQELADKLASDTRQVMQSAWYQQLFPGTRLRQGRQALSNFETTAGGGRFATSVGGTLTGFGADYIILDDPMKPSEALSDAERTSANTWIQQTLHSRLNDKRLGRMVIVMQRLHEEDVIGSLMERAPGTFHLLSFPAIAQEDEVHEFATPFGLQRVERREGEALHPEREPVDTLLTMKDVIGSMVFSAQYLQQPVPVEGNLIRRAWLQLYNPAEIIGRGRIIQSWDTGIKTGVNNDYSVCTTWAVIDQRIYLVAVLRERLEFPALVARVISEAKRFNTERVLIEDKGSGSPLLQQLKDNGFWAHGITPTRDKAVRFAGVTALIEQGRIYVPAGAPWLDDYLDELCGFPARRHDDQVDSTSQALEWIRDEGNPGGLWHYYRQEHEKRHAREHHSTVRLRAPAGISHFIRANGEGAQINEDRVIFLPENEVGAALRAGFERLSD